MTLSLPIAFLAGFLSPCVLPLVPTYLLYLGGAAGQPHPQRRLLRAGLLGHLLPARAALYPVGGGAF